MRKLVHAGILLLSGAVVTFVFLCILLLSSSSVTRWLIVTIDEQLPSLSIAKIDGLLLGELHLSDIKYQSEQVTVSIRSLAYQFRLADLMAGCIGFKSIQASVVDVLLHDFDEQDSESGDIDFIMPVLLQVDKFSLKELSVKQQKEDYLIERVGMAVRYQGQQLQLSQFSLQSDFIQMQGKAEMKLKAQLPFNLEIDIAKSVPELADVKAHLAAQGNLQKIYLDTQVLAPNEIHAQGWIEPGVAIPKFELQVEWPILQWPLQGDKHYASENAHLSLQGNVEHYSVIFDSEIFVKNILAGLLHLEGLGDADQLTLNTLVINALKGDIQAKGRISWVEAISSHLLLQANKLQLASVMADYPGELSLNVTISGQLFNKPDFTVQIEKLQGTVLDKKLQASGQIHYLPEQISINKIQASVGANRLDIQGQLGDQNLLIFKLEAEDLHHLSSDLSGSVFAEGSVQGELKQPVIEFQLQANDVAYQDQRVAKIQAHATVDTSGDGQLDLQLKAEQIVVNGKQVEKLELQSIGQNAHHEVRAQVLANQARLELAMRGTWEPQGKSWQGQVQQLFVRGGSLGSWQIIQASPLKITLAEQQPVQLLTEFCLAQKKGTGLLCINAQPEPFGQKLQGAIKQLPLSILADWMPESISVRSHLHSEFSLSIQEKLHGSMSVTLDPGAIIMRSEKLAVQRLSFKSAQFDAQLLADKMESDLSIILNDANHVKGQLEVDGIGDMLTANINGLLNIQLDEIGFIGAFSDSVSDVEGNIDVQLKLQGLLSNPDYSNSWMKLEHAKLTVEDAGLSVKDLSVDLNHSGVEQVSLHGSADIEGRKLIINGRVDHYASEQQQYELAFRGESLPLLQLPEMQAWLSPDLILMGDKYGARLKGQLTIPKAILTFQTLPEGTVEVSSDELIVTEQRGESKEARYPVDMDVIIKLGKAVSIEGFGLKTRLEGELRARQEKGHLKLFNELNLIDGTYTAYGQDLTLEKGQFLFAGNMQNPGINFLSSRKASDWDDQTIAYMSMTGTLNNPVTQIYTEPASNDSDALAYLLMGAPMSKGDSSSTGLLAQAALSLGREYVDAVMGTVGIDEFDIKSTSLGQNSMVVGKRITPDLYARYIMDVLTTQMQFAVEYKLTDNISIETRAGSTHSSDIKYSIEFD